MTSTLQFRAATTSDIDGITLLQSLNLFDNIAADERSGGFVTVPFTSEQLQNRIDDNAAFVAQHDDEIIAYALCGGWDFYAQWPIFPFMIGRMEGVIWNDCTLGSRSTFQYGPVCIAREWRGQQVLPRLFDVLRKSLAPRFSAGLTFINAQNERSLAAHRKLGMEIIDEWSFNGRDYFTFAFVTREAESSTRL